MTSLRTLMGRPLVRLDDTSTVGGVDHVLVDAASRRVEVLGTGKGKKARFAAWSDTAGVGTDAVMVRDVHEAASAREEALGRGDLDLLGAKVLTDHGRLLGTLDDLELDDTSGALVHLVVAGEQIGADALLGTGTYAVVVRDPWGAPAPAPGWGAGGQPEFAAPVAAPPPPPTPPPYPGAEGPPSGPPPGPAVGR